MYIKDQDKHYIQVRNGEVQEDGLFEKTLVQGDRRCQVLGTGMGDKEDSPVLPLSLPLRASETGSPTVRVVLDDGLA